MGLLIKEKTTESKRFNDYMNRIRNRWNLNGLEVEAEGFGASREKTLQDLIIERDREAGKNMLLAYGTTEYGGKFLRIWFEISRPRI